MHERHVDSPGSEGAPFPMMALEPHLPGEHVKHNDNTGRVETTQELPQAFSHFTLEASGGQLCVCDVQGVVGVVYHVYSTYICPFILSIHPTAKHQRLDTRQLFHASHHRRCYNKIGSPIGQSQLAILDVLANRKGAALCKRVPGNANADFSKNLSE